MIASQLLSIYQQWEREGTKLAGGLTDLAQRATVYHHLYEHSGRNHVFPLIAAHGALWARGQFAFGMRLGRALSWQYFASCWKRERLMQQLHAFADAFRDVNRRVCVATYSMYHFTAAHGENPAAAELIDASLLAALNRMHAARLAGVELSDAAKRELFEAFFYNEQQTVVGPAIENAVAEFDWPLLRWIALQPRIRFAYFPRNQRLKFRNFARRDERIANGLKAFDTAAAVGWNTTEAALRHYDILPSEFFAASARHFDDIRHAALANA
jgi:hypothetical protein